MKPYVLKFEDYLVESSKSDKFTEKRKAIIDKAGEIPKGADIRNSGGSVTIYFDGNNKDATNWVNTVKDNFRAIAYTDTSKM